jgi:hypothetical protein
MTYEYDVGGAILMLIVGIIFLPLSLPLAYILSSVGGSGPLVVWIIAIPFLLGLSDNFVDNLFDEHGIDIILASLAGMISMIATGWGIRLFGESGFILTAGMILTPLISIIIGVVSHTGWWKLATNIDHMS